VTDEPMLSSSDWRRRTSQAFTLDAARSPATRRAFLFVHERRRYSLRQTARDGAGSEATARVSGLPGAAGGETRAARGGTDPAGAGGWEVDATGICRSGRTASGMPTRWITAPR